MLIGSFDIGGTKTIVALVDANGKVVKQDTFLTPIADCYASFDLCIQKYEKMLRECGVSRTDVAGVGVNVPGMFEVESGVLLKAPFARWENVHVRTYFREKLQSDKVYVDNDVKNCALGERYFGMKERYRNFVWITVSTGIGGAVVCEGKLLRGKNNLAGEIGHIKVEYGEHARKCTCGARGCLEAHASGSAITRRVQECAQKDEQFRRTFENAGQPLDAKGCATMAASGMESAAMLYKEAALYLARGIGTVENLLNPDAIILGGGVAASTQYLLTEIQNSLSDYAIADVRNVPILQTELGYNAALIGAAAQVLAAEDEER